MTAYVVLRDLSSGQAHVADGASKGELVIPIIRTTEAYIQSVRPLQEVIDEMLRSLPPLMSEHDVEQLRIQYPPRLASEDPGTFEFGAT